MIYIKGLHIAQAITTTHACYDNDDEVGLTTSIKNQFQADIDTFVSLFNRCVLIAVRIIKPT
ncbi:hypothetical protein ACXHQ0_15020 [Vibrio antiquarius]|uniref:hypothetical protein n=1 Tax=Vibrio harveyi group TaxID=717610 RepID=UPI00215E96A6|nr:MULTISPECIES: hypothetical protein [Vibrio harveyi group]MCS0314384.1 hypothetical protein [Vibrio diabolicus]UYW19356.1 hypothetical protein IF561_29435 [Vibrio parahaemolyticus]